MKLKEGVKEKIIAEIDWYVIEKIRELRTPDFSQSDLSREIGLSDSFVGRVENPNQSAVYKLRHLNLIAKALKVSLADLLPKQPLENDLVKVTIKLNPPTRNQTGEANYEVVRVVALTNEEIADYNKKVLSRPTRSGNIPKIKKRKSTKKK